MNQRDKRALIRDLDELINRVKRALTESLADTLTEAQVDAAVTSLIDDDIWNKKSIQTLERLMAEGRTKPQAFSVMAQGNARALQAVDAVISAKAGAKKEK